MRLTVVVMAVGRVRILRVGVLKDVAMCPGNRVRVFRLAVAMPGRMAVSVLVSMRRMCGMIYVVRRSGVTEAMAGAGVRLLFLFVADAAQILRMLAAVRV